MTADTFSQICENLSNHMWLQGLLIVIGTCFLEDAARCGVGLLVSAGHIRWDLAFFGMTLGGMVGDVGLYVLGRFASFFMFRRRWVDPSRFAWAETWFNRHAVKAIVIARFIPGVRMVTYIAAGTARYPMVRFLFWLFLAAAGQAVLFLQAFDFIGQTLLPYFHGKKIKLIAIAAIVIVLLIANVYYLRRRARKNKTLSSKE